ncbi:MAG TPA: hypothetical protein VF339_06430 [Gammaproteobacteria bacterium]
MRNAFHGWPRWIALAGVLALGSGAGAQEDGDTSAAPPEQAPPRAEAPAPAQRDEARRPRGEADDAEDDVFVPTEEIGADEEVVFPVDI